MPFPSMSPAPFVQDNFPMRILRGVQLVFGTIVLAVAANNISSWQSLGCKSPSRISYNLAAAVITIPIVVYLIVSTGVKRVKVVPWHQFGQLGLDVFLLILWIAAAATSTISCTDACKACKSFGLNYDTGCGYYIDYGDDACNCYLGSDDVCTNYSYANKHKRAILDARNVFEKRARRTSSFSGVKNGGKLGVNIITLILFILSTAGTAYLIFRQRKISSTPTTAPSTALTTAPTNNHEQKEATTQQAPLSPLQEPVSPLHQQGQYSASPMGAQQILQPQYAPQAQAPVHAPTEMPNSTYAPPSYAAPHGGQQDS